MSNEPVNLRKEEAKKLLINAARSVLLEGNLHPTTKLISDTAGVNPSSMTRHFGGLQGLLIETTHSLLEEFATSLGSNPTLARVEDPLFVTRTKIVALLLQQGVDPTLFLPRRETITERFISNQTSISNVSEKTAIAFWQLAALSTEGFTIFGETHPFNEQQKQDTFALVLKIREMLPQIEKELSWDSLN